MGGWGVRGRRRRVSCAEESPLGSIDHFWLFWLVGCCLNFNGSQLGGRYGDHPKSGHSSIPQGVYGETQDVHGPDSLVKL